MLGMIDGVVARGGGQHERMPDSKLWKPMERATYRLGGLDVCVSQWTHKTRGIQVISSLDFAELPQSGGQAGPTWHISVAMRGGRRAKPELVRMARLAFGMADAAEDNHHPGVARHFFMPVDPQWRGVCECKDTELTLVDETGYEWTEPVKDGECRGCELAVRSGGKVVCPRHDPTKAAHVVASVSGPATIAVTASGFTASPVLLDAKP